MEILGHSIVVEKGEGWLHTVTFRTDSGAIVTIEDDTDTIFAYSDTPDALTTAQIGQLWQEWAMGCSHFPAVPMPKAKPIPWIDLDHALIKEISGVALSYIANGQEPLPHRNDTPPVLCEFAEERGRMKHEFFNADSAAELSEQVQAWLDEIKETKPTIINQDLSVTWVPFTVEGVTGKAHTHRVHYALSVFYT